VGQKEIIRREYFLNRRSMREIARELHHGRAVIRKAIYDPRIFSWLVFTGFLHTICTPKGKRGRLI
jgi:hypothetical protein